MKKVLVVFLAVVLALGCCTAAMADGLKVGYYGLGIDQAFFNSLYESLKANCEERGYELIAKFTDGDSAEMRAAYDQFMAQGVDVIVDGNAYSDVIAPYIEQAASDGVPYIALFASFDGDYYTFGASNEDMGTSTGNYVGTLIADEWDGAVDTVFLVGTFSTGAEITVRLTAALPAMAEHIDMTNVEVVNLDVVAGDSAGAYQKVMDALTAHPGQKVAIFCQTDDMCNAAVSAVEAADRGATTIAVGSDCIDAALEYWQTAIKDGNTTAPWRGSIFLDTASYGATILDLAENIIAGTAEAYANWAPVSVAGMGNWEEYWPDLMERSFN